MSLAERLRQKERGPSIKVKFTMHTAMLEKIKKEQLKLRNRSNYERQKADCKEISKMIAFISPRFKKRTLNN